MSLCLFCSCLFLFSTTFAAAFVCPVEESASSCSLMDDCAVCNEGSTGGDEDNMVSHIGCSQCTSGNWLYSRNQCLSCAGTFGDECLHCTDGTGCQECASGYRRTYHSDCSLWSCEFADSCDENCANCQSNNNFPRCAQCNSGYFLGDNTGENGCINCHEEYGDECLFCANLQGCQQCASGYQRVKDDDTNLWYCQCIGDNCIEIIDFESLNGTFGLNLNGYYDLEWSNAFYALTSETTWSIGGNYIDNSGEFGHKILGNNIANYAWEIGSAGGRQFRLIQFDVVGGRGFESEITCDAYLNNIWQYTFTQAGISSLSVSTIVNTVGNTQFIDYFTCHEPNFSVFFFITDHINVIFEQ